MIGTNFTNHGYVLQDEAFLSWFARDQPFIGNAAFVALLADVERRAQQPVTVVLVHHQNRAGQVSGAWEGPPDSLVHVQAQGHGRTRVYWPKTRWSSLLHGTSTYLLWADGEAFTVAEREELTEDTIAAGILAAATELPGESWTKIRAKVKGSDTRKVRDRLLKDGALRNTATVDGWFNLWVAADPAATRSALRTGVRTAPVALPGGRAAVRAVPRSPHKGTGTERNGLTGADDDPEPPAATDIGGEVA